MVQPDGKRVLLTVAVAAMLVLAGCAFGGNDSGSSEDLLAGQSDDLGYAAGGAQDIDNFRHNVEEGQLPLRSDVTHEGLFYDYYFETGEQDCDELFCPAYSRAVTNDPLSNETDRYLSVGLNSNIDAAEFEREKLNLVVVLDVSGSMDSEMAEYHYDDSDTSPDDRETKRKMDAANEATVTLLEQLEDDDRFGLVTFNNEAETVVSLEQMGERDRDALADDIRSIEAGGGTNLESGMTRAGDLVEPHVDEEGYDTRVVYLTDAMPNVGDTSTGGLESRLEDDAERGIHSTFVGVGIDFNSRLVEEITAVRGANYYAVDSAEGFEERMGEEFEYMVTPMVYDLELALESDAYEIEAVYGSPDAEAASEADTASDSRAAGPRDSGELMSVNTLFPSPTEDGASKGGVVLLELNETGADSDSDDDASTLALTASYEDRDGESHETIERVTFADREPEYFETDSVRKAVALSRYATLMENWISHERAALSDDPDVEPAAPDDALERTEAPDLGTWERQSTELQVSPAYAERIDSFRDHFAAEAEAIGDESLEQELDLLETILEAADDPDDGGASERDDSDTASDDGTEAVTNGNALESRALGTSEHIAPTVSAD